GWHVARRVGRDDDEQEDRDREGDQVDDADPRVSRVEPLDRRGDAEEVVEDEREQEDAPAAALALGLAGRLSDRQDALEEALQDRRPRHPRNLLRCLAHGLGRRPVGGYPALLNRRTPLRFLRRLCW